MYFIIKKASEHHYADKIFITLSITVLRWSARFGIMRTHEIQYAECRNRLVALECRRAAQVCGILLVSWCRLSLESACSARTERDRRLLRGRREDGWRRLFWAAKRRHCRCARLGAVPRRGDGLRATRTYGKGVQPGGNSQRRGRNSQVRHKGVFRIRALQDVRIRERQKRP